MLVMKIKSDFHIYHVTFFGDKKYFIPSFLAVCNAAVTYFALATDDVSAFFS